MSASARVLALATTLALVLALLTPQISFADDDLETRTVSVEATITDDRGEVIPEPLCVDITLYASPFILGEDLDDIDVQEELELEPGAGGFSWTYDLEVPGDADISFADVNLFVYDCNVFRYLSATAFFSSSSGDELFDGPLEVDFELERRTQITALTATPDGGSLSDEQCVQLYQYADGERTISSARAFGDRALQLSLSEDAYGAAFQYGVDACTFPDGTVRDFPFQPVFFDGADDLAQAEDVVAEQGEVVDLGTFALPPLDGDTPDDDTGATPGDDDASDDPDEETGPDDGADAPEEETVGGFVDVPAGLVHAEGILWLVDQGITTGVGDGRFAPADPVTRDQMATFLSRALELEAEGPQPFSDVPEGSTHDQAIRALVEAEITGGCAEGLYCPRDVVTRAQMATFLDRALDLDEAEEPAGFTDVPEDFVHAAAIDRLVAAGITTGTGEGLFSPGDAVTRGQMATFLFRALAELDDSDEGGDGEDEANGDD